MPRPQPIDPDVGRVDPAAVVAVAVGGGVGSAARLAVDLVAPGVTATFVVNLLGCALIGGLVVLVAETDAHRLVRPFLGTGLLGGFTTFSVFALDADSLWTSGDQALALGYVCATVLACLAATASAALVARRVLGGASASRGPRT